MKPRTRPARSLTSPVGSSLDFLVRRTMMIRQRSLVFLAGTAVVLLSAVAVFGQSSGAAVQADARAEALADAARKGDAAAVKKLLDEGVDVNSKFRYGTTAL